jgi:hypothetical protein
VKGYTSHVAPYYQYGLFINDATSLNSPKRVVFWLTIGGTSYSISADGAWEYDQWNHLVATYDGVAMRIYRDGTQIRSVGRTGTMSTYATPLVIGAYGNLAKTATYVFGGSLDEAAVYPTALSATQALARFDRGSSGCKSIAGATSSSYALTSSDTGTANTRVVVKAADAQGTTRLPSIYWASPGCLLDGNAIPDTLCLALATVGNDDSVALDCSGTERFCNSSETTISGAGVPTAFIDGNLLDIAAPDPEGVATSGFTGKYAWYNFNLRLGGASECPSGSVVLNNHCGVFWHNWQYYSNGSRQGPAYGSDFKARSGGPLNTDIYSNNPAQKWVRDHGPMPNNGSWSSSSPRYLYKHHFGFQNGNFQGFVSSYSDTFYPGWWSIDPWTIYSSSGTKRDSFQVHGGRNAHAYASLGTHGCVRLPATGMTSLRPLARNYSDNRKTKPGPIIYTNYD